MSHTRGMDYLKPFLPGLESVLDDPDVSEIMINGPQNVWVESRGAVRRHDAPGLGKAALDRAAIQIARPLGLDPAVAPILDARLDDGSRVAICVPPASPHIAITIRRFGNRAFSAQDLVDQGALPQPVFDAARDMLRSRRNLLVSGGTGSGKTTLLNALIALLPAEGRIVSIEDTLELRIERANCVPFEARGLAGGVSIRDLVKHALRHRPDHIVVGEVRGGEAADLLQALNTGHGGSLTTVHANNATSALSRIAACAMQGEGDLPWEVTCRSVVDGIQMVVHMTRRAGRRFVEEALFVEGYDAEKNSWVTDPLWPVNHDNSKGASHDMNAKSKPALSRVTPQARHHYTRFDQIDELVGASVADAELGFMHRLLLLCCLPRTNPGRKTQHVRTNGPHTVIISAVGQYGLPFGSIPRVLLAWLCTEAVRTQSRDLVLGRSLSDFMRVLDILSSNSGGLTGVRTRLHNQMNRLFHCTVELTEKRDNRERFVAGLLVDQGDLWWDAKRPEESVLWESSIRLGESFFKEIITRPIPLDMHVLRALTRSSLGLDLYLWLNYRTFALNQPLRLTWRQLYRQFGADPSKANNKNVVNSFRAESLRELNKIKAAWPGLDYTTEVGCLVLLPTTTPSIPPPQFPILPR